MTDDTDTFTIEIEDCTHYDLGVLLAGASKMLIEGIMTGAPQENIEPIEDLHDRIVEQNAEHVRDMMVESDVSDGMAVVGDDNAIERLEEVLDVDVDEHGRVMDDPTDIEVDE